MSLPAPPLLVITDRKQARFPLEQVVAAAFAGGCRWASVRERDLPPAQLSMLARRLQPLARATGARLTLHGGAEQAMALDFDGVHLAAGSDCARAREIMGADRLLGISVHRREEVAALDHAMVDYAIAGPAFETASKPGYGPVLGGHGLATMRAATKVPIIAIGGITADCIAELKPAGIAGMAVMGGIMRAADPCEDVARLIAAWENAAA